jgi:hypothetical protein
MLPVTGPVAEGAKDTVIVADVPDARFKPFDIPVREKPGPWLMVTLETVTVEPLVFVNVTTKDFVVFTLTFPKLRLEALEFRPGLETLAFEPDDADPVALAVPLHPHCMIVADRSAMARRYGR